MEQKQAETLGQIIDRFDFQKVHDYMVQVDWKWRGEIPTIDDLKRTAAILLVNAMQNSEETMSTGTGGFIAYKFPWGLELVFAMEAKAIF
jgi:hypothetical protein